MEYKIRDSLIEEKIKTARSDRFFYVVAAVLCLIFLTLLYLNTYVFACVIVKGPSMENTMFTDDVLIINTRVKGDYGDIVVINGEKENGEKIIKRIIAKGGDSIKFAGGYVYLKKTDEATFTKLDEPYIKKQGATYYPSATSPTDIAESAVIVIPEGEIYYLGDNRTNSSDSRSSFGTCTVSQIWGTVTPWALSARPFMNFINKILNFGKAAH